jgi:hypothetical protein
VNAKRLIDDVVTDAHREFPLSWLKMRIPSKLIMLSDPAPTIES